MFPSPSHFLKPRLSLILTHRGWFANRISRAHIQVQQAPCSTCSALNNLSFPFLFHFPLSQVEKEKERENPTTQDVKISMLADCIWHAFGSHGCPKWLGKMSLLQTLVLLLVISGMFFSKSGTHLIFPYVTECLVLSRHLLNVCWIPWLIAVIQRLSLLGKH